ncbi:hypothetical protein EPL05_09560 [Mucilaginibacter gilvus]|uniref:Uncharacterized protein n=1 Tax=Mucilaginibacter gilvus TaxID=2305909 RepID=A0A444MRM3_9SPHI|nr:hypothetical protein EPL05_09560 [Mucilaginibacter gilvus]
MNKNVTFHCSRPTYATLMLNHDVNIYTVMKLLGNLHKNNSDLCKGSRYTKS